MVDLASIYAAISGLKTASDIAQSMVALHDTAAVQGKTIELQGAILNAQSNALAAQSEQSALIQRISDLEEKIAGMEAWNAEKQRYMLHEPTPGVFTYILKEEEKGTEPSHQLCANCYNIHSRPSILQLETRNPGMARVLICQNCGLEIYITGYWLEAHSKASGRSRKLR